MGNGETAKYNFDSIIGINEEFINCKEIALRASQTSSSVLIYGETGTGKELFVQSIHNSSNRKDKAFIAQNCAAIPGSLLESILFGTVKGSFTGAENRKGLFELADGGTLYLDELNSMPVELQVKLLRVLQEGTIVRLGSGIQKKVDVRVIASVNEVPEDLAAKGILRRDLYFRLNVVRINIPPLRKRKEDIPLLVDHFIEKYNKRFRAAIHTIDDEALERLILWQWEGNLRELEHVIEAVFNLKQKGSITLEDLDKIGFNKVIKKTLTLKESLEEAEKGYIKEALVISRNNVSKAAKFLGIPRQTLQSKIKKLNIKL